MVAPAPSPFHELRRRIRAPYCVPVQILFDGPSASGETVEVASIDANEFGMRIESENQLPRIKVRLRLRAPDGSTLDLRGSVVHSTQIDALTWQGGIEFDAPEPRLSANRIDMTRIVA